MKNKSIDPLVLCLVAWIGILVLFGLVMLVSYIIEQAKTPIVEIIEVPVEVLVEVPVEVEKIVIVEVEVPVEVLVPYTPVPAEPLGEYTLTAYCSCATCCDRWAKDRPKLNGQTIVFTAIGAVAREGVTIAVDPDVIPYGSAVYIEGLGVRIAQDCGGGIKGNRIDVYFSDHQAALDFGRQKAEVWGLG